MAATAAPLDYLLHLADNALVLGQRNAQWCAHGPVLEEDIAQANISLDLIGQARLLYQHAATVQGGGATEDSLAYLRDAQEFRNFTLLELPHHAGPVGHDAAARDYATTIARNFLYSEFALLQWDALQTSRDAQLAAIAGRSVKEMRYHLRHARDWLVRLGDGTAQSHARMQAAVDHLLPYTHEFWDACEAEAAASVDGTAIDPRAFRSQWDTSVDAALAQATLRRPVTAGFLPRGKQGLHSEHLGELLGEMQELARQHPGATW
ncbi:MAG: phenylacetate-CoA oxygenase subunit PaaC [Ramlibacter sp.]